MNIYLGWYVDLRLFAAINTSNAGIGHIARVTACSVACLIALTGDSKTNVNSEMHRFLNFKLKCSTYCFLSTRP